MVSSLQECAPYLFVIMISRRGRPDEHLWVEAWDKEIKKLFEMGTFPNVDENDIPLGHKSINCCMSFKIKKVMGISWSIAHVAMPTAGNRRWDPIVTHLHPHQNSASYDQYVP